MLILAIFPAVLEPMTNPIEKGALDDKNNKAKTKKQFLKCKSHKTISTMNVRTLRRKHKRLELIFNMNRINVLAVIDHRSFLQ